MNTFVTILIRLKSPLLYHAISFGVRLIGDRRGANTAVCFIAQIFPRLRDVEVNGGQKYPNFCIRLVFGAICGISVPQKLWIMRTTLWITPHRWKNYRARIIHWCGSNIHAKNALLRKNSLSCNKSNGRGLLMNPWKVVSGSVRSLVFCNARFVTNHTHYGYICYAVGLANLAGSDTRPGNK